MLAHLTSSMGWNWATLIVVVLILAALAAFVWSWRAMHRDAPSRPPTVLTFGVPVVAAAVAFGAWYTADEWDWLLEDGTVRSEGAEAPPVDVPDGAERFTLVEGSQVTYRVDERLGGNDATAIGTTAVLAGEIAVDREVPSDSVLGTIVVNVERFESDSNLRDKRIRHDFLESTEFPYATFEPTSVDGLPGTPAAGEPIPVEITGDLTVKETTATETFAGWVRIEDDRLTAEVTATVLMSTYDVGPIAISGLVSTSDEVELTFSLVAAPADVVDADDLDLAGRPNVTDAGPGADGGGASGTTAPSGPTLPAEPAYDDARFSSAVLPTIETHCASCHVPGGPGATTVEFATIGDVAEVAGDIALVTDSRYMPPWTASDRSVDFEHDWSLSDEQIAEIAAWADAGGVLDLDPSSELEPRNAIVVPLDADVTIAGEPYTGSLDQRDDYRCQIYELPPADDTRWITGYTIDPDQVEVVHHAIFFRADAAAMDDAVALDARDEQPGWPCFGLAGLRGTEQIGGWAPGQQPKTYADGSGIRMEPGDFLVTQIHYHYDHDVPADQSELRLEFADDDDLERAGGTYDDVVVTTYLAPAEIPCREDEDGPLCDRDTVIADIRDRFGDFAAIIPDGLIAQCGADLQELMADTDGVASASCDHRVEAFGEIVGVLGHMHEFGETFTMTLNPGTAGEQILLDIPNWAFEWQFDYRPVDSIRVGPGDVIRVECSWDRSLAPMPEPRHITWNEGTEDEMCYSTLSTVDRT